MIHHALGHNELCPYTPSTTLIPAWLCPGKATVTPSRISSWPVRVSLPSGVSGSVTTYYRAGSRSRRRKVSEAAVSSSR